MTLEAKNVDHPARPDWRPIPDPTVLTTQQLLRENASLRELVFTRLEAMDKAVTLLQANANKSPSIGELFFKYEEKFASVQIQFAERDTRTEQTRTEGKVSIDAALQAAKEAVSEQNKSNQLAIAKSEAATTKQIDAIGTLISTGLKALDDKITSGQKASDDKVDDLKTRITAIETYKTGSREAVTDSRQVSFNYWGHIFGFAGILIGIASVIAMALRH